MPSLVLKASSCLVTKMKRKELNAANGISVFQKQQVTFDPKNIYKKVCRQQTTRHRKPGSLTARAFSVKQAHPLGLSLRKWESLPFVTLETRKELGRVTFAKAYGTVAKDRETPLANHRLRRPL